ncbi:porin [Yoonia sp. SS1-5]|uniref:Porin n=1 Tax=Yoonia rhodophyticola TaxID=3137370 RepID=A0AAN0MBD1_9RHOB
MKSILLTTTAIVAFAGAAAADGHATPGIAFAGEATLGYNDDIEDGFYWDAEIDTTMTAALDNGVVAAAEFGLNVVENDLGEAVATSDYVLSLSTDNAALKFGDLDPVAEDNFSPVDGEVPGFNDQDVHFDPTATSPDGVAAVADDPDAGLGAGFDAILTGEVSAAGWKGMISFGVEYGNDDTVGNGSSTDDDLDAMQLFVQGDVGPVELQFAYQDAFLGADEVYGVAATATVAGAELKGSYIDDGTENSLGLGASYPVGPVTVGGYYTINDVADDNFGVTADYSAGGLAVSAAYEVTGGVADVDDNTNEFTLEGSYEVGQGVTLFAGVINTDVEGGDNTNQYYAAGTYDLGGGAELLVSYAENEANEDDDEIGDPEYLHGTTVELSLAF